MRCSARRVRMRRRQRLSGGSQAILPWSSSFRVSINDCMRWVPRWVRWSIGAMPGTTERLTGGGGDSIPSSGSIPRPSAAGFNRHGMDSGITSAACRCNGTSSCFPACWKRPHSVTAHSSSSAREPPIRMGERSANERSRTAVGITAIAVTVVEIAVTAGPRADGAGASRAAVPTPVATPVRAIRVVAIAARVTAALATDPQVISAGPSREATRATMMDAGNQCRQPM